jgi:hypothetical protein
MPRRPKKKPPLPAPPPTSSPTPIPTPIPTPLPPSSPPRTTTPPLRSAIRQTSRPRTPTTRRIQFEDDLDERDRRARRRAQELKEGDAVREAKKAAELKKKEEFRQRQHDNELQLRQIEQEKQRIQAEEQARREQSMQRADEQSSDMDDGRSNFPMLNHTVRRHQMEEIDHELEVEAADFDVYVTWKAFVDKKLIYSTNKGKMRRRELIERHEDYEFDMENRITDEPFEGDWEIFNRSVAVRSRSSRGRIHIETVDDFSAQGWSQIEDILLQQWIRFEYPLEMTVEIKARSIPLPKPTAKRTREPTSSAAPNSPSNSPQHKRERASRTTQARGHNEAREEMYQRLEASDQKIMEKWQCTLTNCRNYPKYCLIRGLDHYPLLTPDIRHWARQIEAMNATVDGPPNPLAEDILARGPSDYNYKAPLHHQKVVQKNVEKTDFTERMGQFMEMQGNMLHMNMTQQMAENMERHQRRQEEKEERDLARERAREAARDTILSQHPPPPSTYEYPVPSNPLPLPARLNPHSVIPITPPPIDRPSSPVTTPEHEEDAITLFFRWKEGRYRLEEGKETIRNALRTVRREMWSIDDLKAMEDNTTVQYKRAMEVGLPDGLARQFHRDWRAFKPTWRTGRVLLSLGERQV